MYHRDQIPSNCTLREIFTQLPGGESTFHEAMALCSSKPVSSTGLIIRR